MKRLIKLVLACVATIPLMVQAQQVHEYNFDNGLKLLIKEDHRAPVVISQVWYKVGSSYEYGGTTGISHALEHMMFKGTPKYGQGELDKIVASNGGVQNAFTGTDYTGYWQIFSENKLAVSFDIESDRMQHLTLDPKEFSKEIQVVMEERRLRTDDNPQSLTLERFMAAAFIANPYHQPIVGWMEDLKRMTVKDLRHWYQQWYAPNNAVLVVVGDVVPSQVFDMVNKRFGHIPSKKIQLSQQMASEKPLGTRRVEVSLPAQLPWLVMGYNVPVIKSLGVNAWEPYALEVVAGILDGGKSARLSKTLVREKRMASTVGVSYNPYDRLNSLFTINATPTQKQNPHALEKAILAQLKRLQVEKVTSSELQRVKAQVVAQNVYNKDSIVGQANELGRLEVVGLSWKLADQFVDRINKVTAEQVQAVMKKYFLPERLTVATLKPLPMKAPHNQPVQQLPAGGRHVR